MGEGGNLRSGAQQCCHSNRHASVSIKRPRFIHVALEPGPHVLTQAAEMFFVKYCKLFLISKMPCKSSSEPELLHDGSGKHH